MPTKPTGGLSAYVPLLGRSRSEAWDTLQIGTQLRVVAALSVISAIALASVVIALWEIRLARAHLLEHVEEFRARVNAELSQPGDQPVSLQALVNGPAVLAAHLRNEKGEIVSEYGVTALHAADARVTHRALTPAAPGEARSAWRWLENAVLLGPLRVESPVTFPGDEHGTLVVLADQEALWTIVGTHMTGIPFVLLIGCILALVTARMFQRRVTDPLSHLAVATRGGQWTSSEQQAGATASVNAVSEIIDNFEIMRERLAKNEQELLRVRRDTECDVERRTAELMQRLEVAEAAARARGDFLANMSHEVRTPMNGVVGMAELLSRTTLDERQQRFLRSMRAAADAMVKIINDILDVTKIEAGKMEFTPEPCVPRDLIEDVAQLYAARAQTKGLELICRIEPSVPSVVSADVLRLRQVLGNLVSNAVKYTQYGEIVVRASCDEARDGRRHLYFEVADSGPGIPKEEQAAIFEPYKQSAGVSHESGTGLGLPIAVRLVKLMGGSGIDLHSTVGHGSRFVFWLPCETLEMNPGARPPRELKGMRVLVVDDNATSYLFLEELIESWGAQVMVLQHGRLVRDRLRGAIQEKEPFDVVVLDHSLPDITIPEVLLAIRTDPETVGTHVVLLSALDFEAEPIEGMTLEPDICISKPVRQQTLAEALQRARSPAVQPAARERTAAQDAAAQRTVEALVGLKVLVVDDNAINREVAQAMLEERACEIAVAENGSEAVVQASAQRFDLILMDCQMPVLDGYAATENIRREEHAEARSRALIVALTANVMPADRERCLAAGMDDVLIKPFSGAQLDEILRRAAQHSVHNRDVIDARRRPTAESTAISDSSADAESVAPEFDFFSAGSAAPEADIAEPILDAEQVEAIRALRKPQLFEQLCGMLRDRAPSALYSIDDALKQGDLATVRIVAHGLRSPAGSLGGRRFSAWLGRCENAAAQGDLDEARRCGSRLRSEYERLDVALDVELGPQGDESQTGT